jgi:hypothetical protein
MDPPGTGDRIARVLEVYSGASTTPALVETEDGNRWAMKFGGAGPGPYGLLIEHLAIAIARALGAPAPRSRPLMLPQDFPWMAGTDEFDAMLQRSYGWNLGIAYLPGAEPAGATDLASIDPAVLDAIALADCFLQNVDRTVRNPNLLRSGGRVWTIDYGACLYLSRSLGRPRPPASSLPAGHLLAGRPISPGTVLPPSIDFAALVAASPPDWIAATGSDAPTLAGALARDYAAWSALIRQ